ncbi:MAG: transglutaminase-like cysteine peptidase [Gammaproteobacteria bacterium]
MKSTGRSRSLVLLHFVGYLALPWIIIAGAETGVLDDKLLDRVEQEYGVQGRERVLDWGTLIRVEQGASNAEKLERVNRFFNEINFVSDIKHWGEEDYWATPIEFLASNAGDCEDFAVAKYFTLKELGVPIERMSLTYVKALKLNQAHMVLTYIESPDAEPLVLDNLIGEIKPASLRRDLLPVYSFNGDNLWLAKERGRGQLVGKASRLGRWSELMRRMAEHGIKKAKR